MADQARRAPTAGEMEALAHEALARIPEPFAGHLANAVLFVEEFADDATLAEMDMDPYELTGLYRGRPVGEKSAFDAIDYPEQIHLYRQPLLAEWCETGVDLHDLIRHVIVHEVGHHFGLSDDDMHALEDGD
ncbi:metallopeptidase family protein [Sphingomonas sp. Leaf25]|uniref:metallopeptidase family protein n=1 Tax=Sphingomonas sp. Leaf25 TaxID=1735692 RepID=UPI0006FFAF2F|nr:metallopeptidase family protein [Sphingomonas sp. Leaf25]KQM97693.1 neutral zinc metallopeptidase [Sphingomonas sp. Leaf25]